MQWYTASCMVIPDLIHTGNTVWACVLVSAKLQQVQKTMSSIWSWKCLATFCISLKNTSNTVDMQFCIPSICPGMECSTLDTSFDHWNWVGIEISSEGEQTFIPRDWITVFHRYWTPEVSVQVSGMCTRAAWTYMLEASNCNTELTKQKLEGLGRQILNEGTVQFWACLWAKVTFFLFFWTSSQPSPNVAVSILRNYKQDKTKRAFRKALHWIITNHEFYEEEY